MSPPTPPARGTGLNFRTAYEDHHGFLVRDTREIAKNYLKGWFVFDLLASIPFGYVGLLMHSASTRKTGQQLKVLKVLRLLRIVKLLRLRRMGPAIKRLMATTQNVSQIFQLLALVLIIIYVAHVVGCIWFVIGEQDKINGWVARQTIWNETTTKVETYSLWLRSFYWAITTLTTIGYGDITANTDNEMLFSIFAELLGTMAFSTIAGILGSLVANNGVLQLRQKGNSNTTHTHTHTHTYAHTHTHTLTHTHTQSG